MTIATYTILTIAIMDGTITSSTWEGIALREGEENTREFRTRLYTQVENEIRKPAIDAGALYHPRQEGLAGFAS